MDLNLNDMRRKLEMCLTEDLRKEYFALLRRWFLFKSPITKVDFDTEVRKLLVNEEQIRCHNYFMLAFLSKRTSGRVKSTRNTTDKGAFESAEYVEYVQPASPTMLTPSDYENRSAAAELFMPDSGFVSSRIAITTWENGLDGADESVTEIIVHACQSFVRNIITAMISRKKGYKIRDGKFQYGFNLPVPDPLLRNSQNIIDETQEPKTELGPSGDAFIPKSRPSLENCEQEAAFAYSCSKRRKGDNILTVRLLYETLKENPRMLGSYNMYNNNILKLGVQIESI